MMKMKEITILLTYLFILGASTNLLSSSELEQCTTTEDVTKSEELNCDQKLVLLLSVES